MDLLTALGQNLSLDSVFNPWSLIIAPLVLAAYLVILGVYRRQSAGRGRTREYIHTKASQSISTPLRDILVLSWLVSKMQPSGRTQVF